MKNKLLILDRDGTLIFDRNYLNDPAGVEYLPELFPSLKRMQAAGFLFVVATNQSGIPRGMVSEENMHKIHQKMEKDFQQQGLKIAKFYFSPHLPESDHPTRKPNPGMLLLALEDLNGEAKDSWMVGDKVIDVQAGHNAGMRSALLGHNSECDAEVVAKNWDQLVQKILEHE